MLIAGVDGCRGGWLCLLHRTPPRKVEILYRDKLVSLLRNRPRLKVVAIDIPIGLWEKGDRECDKSARALLGWPRRASVFPPPPRSALKAANYEEARELSKKANGKGLARQSFAILGKIREVDEWINPQRQKRVHEVHPEVSFWALNHGSALKCSKKSKEGREERLRLLRPLFEEIDELLTRINTDWAAPDDLLDAAAALWTARRIAAGKEFRLASHGRDSKGLRMEIAY